MAWIHVNDLTLYRASTEGDKSPSYMPVMADNAAGLEFTNRASAWPPRPAHGGGYCSIHPALPWYFNNLFDIYYADRQAEATRALVEAIGSLGGYYHSEYPHGNPDVIVAVAAEEDTLLHARELARVPLPRDE